MNTPHDFIDRGWNIFPVYHASETRVDNRGRVLAKRSMVGEWKSYQTNRVTKEQIDEWVRLYPDCSWAVLGGKISGGLHIIDFDDPEVYETFFKEKLKSTFTVRTPSGGYHAYFYVDAELPNLTIYKELYNIDTRGSGGYVLLPDISKGYSIINDVEPMRVTEDGLRDLIDVWRTVTDEELFDFDAIKSDVAITDAVRHYGDGDVSAVRSKDDYVLIKCPFHPDKEPSCAIHLRYFKCHGCGKRGSIIDFVMAHEHFDKPSTAAMAIEKFMNRQYRLPQAGGNGDIQAPDKSDLSGDWIDEEIKLNVKASGFIKDYIDFGKQSTDAFEEYHYAGALTIISSVVGRKRWIELDQDDFYTNLYEFILGPSTLARKSIAMKKTKRVLNDGGLYPVLMYESFSPEAFIETMSEDSHRTLVVDEAGIILANMKKNYMAEMKDILMRFYDGSGYSKKLRRKKNDDNVFRVEDPHFNILFATVPETLYEYSDGVDAISGWLARFIFFKPKYNKKSKPFTRKTEKTYAHQTAMEDSIKRISEWINSTQPQAMDFGDGVFEAFQDWQMNHDELMKENANAIRNMVMGRLIPTALKIAMLHAISEMRNIINMDDISEAMREVDEFFIATSLNVIENIKDADDRDVTSRTIGKIERYLMRNGGEGDRRDILNKTRVKVKEFLEVIETMKLSGAIREERGEEHGMNTTVKYILQKGV